MSERIERYARGLEGLSIEELSEGAARLVSFQRRNEAALIAHLAEISRRRGHLELGYRSLFDYCTVHLGLGKYSVWNRTQVAGVSRRLPQVLGALAEGKVSLSSLGVLAPHLSEENVDRLLAEAERKTKDEVREIVARLQPKPEAEPSIRRRERVRATSDGRARSRYIPSAVCERVLERAGYRCEYTGPAGVRCTARAGLEIDHIEPWGKGGSSGEVNLRALCRAHNLFAAVGEFGEELVRGKIGAVGRGVSGLRTASRSGLLPPERVGTRPRRGSFGAAF